MSSTICVVLNNQHQPRVDDFLRRCRTPEDRMLFQPYTKKYLRSIRKLDDDHELPVPIYLVVGQYGDQAVAAGELVKVEYARDVPRSAHDDLLQILPGTDDHIYGTNLLFLSHGRRLKRSIPVEHFKKVSDGKPLRRGRWPAVICYSPEKSNASAISSQDRDDPETALEGHLRLLYVRHRQRERRLRTAKIRAVLRQTGTLTCEVRGCDFDFQKVYGVLGQAYAQVHHLRPFGANGERRTALDDLAIVCANCHAMIHRGGQCRSLREVSASMVQAMRPKERLKLAAPRA